MRFLLSSRMVRLAASISGISSRLLLYKRSSSRLVRGLSEPSRTSRLSLMLRILSEERPAKAASGIIMILLAARLSSSSAPRPPSSGHGSLASTPWLKRLSTLSFLSWPMAGSTVLILFL